MDSEMLSEYLRGYIGREANLSDLPSSGKFYIEIDSNSLMVTCEESAWAKGFPIDFKAGRYRIRVLKCKDGVVLSKEDVSKKVLLRFKKKLSQKLRG